MLRGGGAEVCSSNSMKVAGAAIARFGTISTVYYQDSPFIRFDLYV
jgi:hypothetical protein